MSSEAKDPTTVAGMMTAINSNSDGTNILKESIQTFSDPDGSSKKGDILVTTQSQALLKLKGMIEKAKGQTRNEKKKAKWDFKTCPCDLFNKTLDDTFMIFVTWAKVKGSEDQYNVSKAFRRVESYADWMDESAKDLEGLTTPSVKAALDAFNMLVSIDKEGNFVWWFDLSTIDKKAIKEDLTPEESLRAFVWYSHYILYDQNAQDNGMVIVENCAKMGFFDLFTLMPMKLGAKLDRLTIGVLPIKCKKIYLLEEPRWMKMLMKLMGMFLSKKMKSRIKTMGDKFDQLGEELGEECIPKKFGPLEGKMEVDPIVKTYFSN